MGLGEKISGHQNQLCRNRVQKPGLGKWDNWGQSKINSNLLLEPSQKDVRLKNFFCLLFHQNL
jgi:hypothetical protein